MNISRGASALLDLLNWYASKFKRVYPSQLKLAEHLKVTVRQIQRYVRELRDAAMVTAKKAGRAAAEYTLSELGKMSGRSRVEVASKSRLAGAPPYMLNSVVVSRPRVARKPPQRELTGYEILKEKYGL